MAKTLALIGTRFGKLTVIGYDGRDKFGKHRWLCACDCQGPNSIKSIEQGKLFRKDSTPTRSCGCLVLKHGASANSRTTPTYRTWVSINERIKRPENPSYKYYGAKGIKICERWDSRNPEGFSNFLADMGERPEGKTIGRINVFGNYEPGNCRWETAREQASNKGNNRVIEIAGLKMTIAEWSRQTGVSQNTIFNRLSAGWDASEAITKPPKKLDQSWNKFRMIEAGGRRLSVKEWAEVTGLSPGTIYARLRSGWDEEKAVLTPPTR